MPAMPPVESDRAIRVLCVDDHPLIRKGIASILANEPDMQLVGEAADGREAIKAFREVRPDVTLMDLRMPELDGIAATRTIREEFPSARIIALTSYEGDQDIYRMLLERQIDAITFTSASTVKNFAKIYGEEQAADLLRTTVVASIGPVTAEAAQQLGIQTTVMPERYTIPDLVDALVEHFRSELTVRS